MHKLYFFFIRPYIFFGVIVSDTDIFCIGVIVSDSDSYFISSCR